MSKPVITKPGARVRALLQTARFAARRMPIPLSIKLSMVSWLRQHPAFHAILTKGTSTPVPPQRPRDLSARDLADYAAQIFDISRTNIGANLEYVPHCDEAIDFTRSPLKLVAFYLPQFHPIPENDAWWGKGFTEWTNTAKARPLFRGHYQPHVPADLGFYDLRVPETRAQQAEMAERFGVEGFCYYHYWFAGKRILNRPFDEVVTSGEPKFPFCLCWANQTWSGV